MIKNAKACLRWCLGGNVYDALSAIKAHALDWRVARVKRRRYPSTFPQAISAALGMTPKRSDIVDHVGALFYHTVLLNARTVVELGTRGGESTRAHLAAVAVTNGRVLSIDIDDCSHVRLPQALRSRWEFIRADDVVFGKEQFPSWCQQNSLPVAADIVFVDTSHLYEHTVREIAAWHGYVRAGGAMIFHDTNMGEGVYRRNDGSIGRGWDNQRGVIRAIEEFLGSRYDENAVFVDITPEWIVSHQPLCNGMTILLRTRANERAANRGNSTFVTAPPDVDGSTVNDLRARDCAQT
jgi:predicted O-methyltransferase YrrM